jgi:hypothetical protein
VAKGRTSFTLSKEANDLLAAIAQRMGINRTAALEVLIRERSDKEGLRAPANATPAPPP